MHHLLFFNYNEFDAHHHPHMKQPSVVQCRKQSLRAIMEVGVSSLWGKWQLLPP